MAAPSLLLEYFEAKMLVSVLGLLDLADLTSFSRHALLWNFGDHEPDYGYHSEESQDDRLQDLNTASICDSTYSEGQDLETR